MNLLRSQKNRSRLSDVVYITLNITLAIILLLVTLQINSIWLPLGIMLLSKWRIFAVRPRFWLANVTANIVDVVVGISHVIFLHAADGSLALQIGLTLGFIFWLLFVKPRSKRMYVVAQAVAAVCVGTNALVLEAFYSDPAVFVICMWLLGFAAVRHVLLAYDEPMVGFYSTLWGVILAELGWIGFHWQITYTLPNSANFKLTQLSLLATLLTFLATRAYASYHEHGVIKSSDMMIPMVFTAGTIALLLTFFNQSNILL